MADNITLDPGTGGAVIATDDIGGFHYQLNKLAFGPLDTATLVTASTGLPVNVISGSLAVTNAGTFVVQVDGSALTALQAIDANTDTLAIVGTGAGASALRVTLANDSAALSVDDGGASLTIDGTVAATQSGTWTVDFSATDRSILNSLDDGFAAEAAALGTGVLLQGDDGTDRKNVNVDPTTGDVQVDVTNTVTVSGTVTADAGTGIATSALQTTGNGILTTIDADTGSIATTNSTIAGAVSGTEMQVDVVAALPAGSNNIGDVDIASITAGNNLIGNVGISGARTAGGTAFHYNAGTNTLTQVSSTAAQIYWLHVMNLSASVVYLQIFNLASASVTLGTTDPSMEFAIPTQGDTNGAGFTLAIPNGIAMSTGLSWAITTTKKGATAATANTALLNMGYAN